MSHDILSDDDGLPSFGCGDATTKTGNDNHHVEDDFPSLEADQPKVKSSKLLGKPNKPTAEKKPAMTFPSVDKATSRKAGLLVLTVTLFLGLAAGGYWLYTSRQTTVELPSAAQAAIAKTLPPPAAPTAPLVVIGEPALMTAPATVVPAPSPVPVQTAPAVVTAKPAVSAPTPVHRPAERVRRTYERPVERAAQAQPPTQSGASDAEREYYKSLNQSINSQLNN